MQRNDPKSRPEFRDGSFLCPIPTCCLYSEWKLHLTALAEKIFD